MSLNGGDGTHVGVGGCCENLIGPFMTLITFLSACLCFPWRCQAFPSKLCQGPTKYYYLASPSRQDIILTFLSILPFFLPLNDLVSIYYVYLSPSPVHSGVRKIHQSINESIHSCFSFIPPISMNLLGSLGCDISLSGLLCSLLCPLCILCRWGCRISEV